MSRLKPTAEDYGGHYLVSCSLDGEESSWENPTCRGFFTQVAKTLLAIGPPIRRLLDVGCANGLLVKALVTEGVDARGIDLSSDIIDDAPCDIRHRLEVASATTPIEGHYDLVTCVEVLEHLDPADAQTAMDNICRVSDRLIFTSTPSDFAEPTHINVRPTANWASDFASRGFFRRTDIDLSFITPWGIYLERADVTLRHVVYRYESLLSPLQLEVAAKREALIQAQRGAAKVSNGTELQHREELISRLQHELLTLRDHAISKEAAAGTARVRREVAEAERDDLRRQIEEIRASERWRLGGMLVTPVAAVSRRRKAT